MAMTNLSIDAVTIDTDEAQAMAALRRSARRAVLRLVWAAVKAMLGVGRAPRDGPACDMCEVGSRCVTGA